MDFDTPGLSEFVDRQRREFGGNLEIDAGLWAVFVVADNQADENELARTLLAGAPFKHESGHAEGDQYVLYYVRTAERGAAVHWLDDLHKRLVGEVRDPTPDQRKLLQDLAESNMPHRVAQKLVDDHTAGTLTAGCIRQPAQVRGLLDRLHVREPLFYSAFHLLLAHHLLDMLVLLQQIIPEDIELTNEAISGAVSRDPFLQTRQTAAAEIRRLLIEFCVINALDQQKNVAIKNPYAGYMDLMRQDDQVLLTVDGKNVAADCGTFVNAVHSIRRNVYLGGKLNEFDTQVPWMRSEIALPFRFIKQRLDMHRDLTTLDGLYMLERAVV